VKARDFSYRKVETPVVLQMEAAECGAAALGMVLGYFGRHVPLRELRAACGVSREGCKASNVLSAARGHGLAARGLHGEIEALNDLALPVMIYWNFNHFVVLEGWASGGTSFFLNDPACGRREVDAEEFQRSFTGVILSFSPGPDFVKSRTEPWPFASFRKDVASAPGLWIFVTLCALLMVFPGLAVAGLIRVFVDKFLIDGEAYLLLPVVASLGLAAMMQVFLTALQHGALMRWQQDCAEKKAGNYFVRVLSLPMTWFAGRTAGEMAGRFLLPSETSSLIASKLAPVMLSSLPMAGFAAMMIAYDAPMALVAIGLSGGSLLASALSSRDRSGERQNIRHLEGAFAGAAIHGLTVLEHLKCGGRDGFLRRLDGLRTQIRNQRQHLESSRQLAMVIPSLLSVCGFAGLVTLGALHILAGSLTVGALVAFLVLWLQLQVLVRGWLRVPTLLQELKIGQTRLGDLPEHHTSVPPTATQFEKLEIKNLSFGYSRTSGLVLDRISFSLEPGKHVVLTGASGAGKSTVVKLLSGLLDPWSGEVLLNGNPVSPAGMAFCAAVVEQEIVFFRDTIAANLRLGNAGADVAEALRVTRLEDVLAARPDGMLLDNGRNFSGGQRQRLDIARALARKAGLILLDEAVTGLDAEAAALIGSELQRRGCAVFQVSHRRDIMRMADEILVLDGGRIVERGSFSELLRTGPVFQKLLAL